MGSGIDIQFWEKRWVVDVPLKDSFRSLFSLASDPKEFVANSFDDKRNVWMLRLCRDLNVWEMDELYSLLSLLDGLRLNPNMVDGLVWIISKNGGFYSKFFYVELAGHGYRFFFPLEAFGFQVPR